MPGAPFTWTKAGLELEIGFGDFELAVGSTDLCRSNRFGASLNPGRRRGNPARRRDPPREGGGAADVRVDLQIWPEMIHV
jgi:hypothetical protein